MFYQYIKALHIIFVVTWFAGLFYIVRLFIYQIEAQEAGKLDWIAQLQLMQRRLWFGITWPSAVLTLCFGSTLAFLWGSLPFWLLLKLGFVLGLFVYHFYCHYLFIQLQQNIVPRSATWMRFYNELATLFLVAIVFIVVLKDGLSLVYGLIGFVLFTAMLLIAIRIYKKTRKSAS